METEMSTILQTPEASCEHLLTQQSGECLSQETQVGDGTQQVTEHLLGMVCIFLIIKLETAVCQYTFFPSLFVVLGSKPGLQTQTGQGFYH
jgi:hypothetical protein